MTAAAERKTLRIWGFAMLGPAAVLTFLLRRHPTARLVPAVLGACFALAAAFAPRWLAGPKAAFEPLAHFLAWIVNGVALLLAYFVGFAPVGLARRLGRRSSEAAGRASHWREKAAAAGGARHLERQYT